MDFGKRSSDNRIAGNCNSENGNTAMSFQFLHADNVNAGYCNK